MAKQHDVEVNKDLEGVAKSFIRFPKEVQHVEQLPYGYIVTINKKRFKIEAKEL